ncbi:MAG: hypothetical protein ACKV2T_15190 [Kofleriaceae bacterium]
MGVTCWTILVGISMLSACGQKSSEPAPASGSAPIAPAPAAPKAAISAPERPTLAEPTPETPDVPAAPVALEPPPPQAPADLSVNPGTEFERQTRDPTWAGPTEAEIKNRVRKLGARVDAAECRHDRCMIALRGSESQMTDLLAKLESPAGLQGYAQSIYLTAPVEQGGNLVVRAYATFDR